MTLNNPLSLLSAKILGVGVEIVVENVDGKVHLCVTINAVVWEKCWKWPK
jgi:hypothetical protein